MFVQLFAKRLSPFKCAACNDKCAASHLKCQLPYLLYCSLTENDACGGRKFEPHGLSLNAEFYN